MTDGQKFLGCLGAITLTVAALTVGAILEAWVLVVMWGWYVVPLFGLPALTKAFAFGLTLVASLLTHQTSDCKEEEEEDSKTKFSKAIVRMLLRPLWVLLLGCIGTFFL